MSSGAGLLITLLVLALVFPLPASAVQETAGDEQTLLLYVNINGRVHEGLEEIVQRNAELFVTPAQLLRLGLISPAVANQPPDALIGLSSVKSWSWTLDAAAQMLALQVPLRSLKTQQLLARPERSPTNTDHSDFGAVLNYDTQFTRDDDHSSSSVLNTLRVFGAFGVAQSSVSQTRSQNFNRTVRLDSTYTLSNPSTLRTFNAGDFINAGLNWTRPVRMFGVQMTTNFGLRPDLVTYPRPGISGEVAVPSSVDIFVNGLHQSSTQVEPGPFELSQLPVTSGGGDVSVVVKDPSGRQTTQTLPFYASSLLLNEGLDSLAVQAGSVRRQYATRSNDYAQPAASLTYRHGATQTWSLETHLESTSGLAMGGVGTDLLVGNLGVLSASLASSSFEGQTGLQYGVGFTRDTPCLSFGLSVLKADEHFSDIASANQDSMPRTTLRANLGMPLPGVGTLGLVYVKKLVNLYTLVDGYADYVQPSERISTSTLSATFSTPLPMKAYGFVTAFHDFEGESGNGLYIGISVPIGPTTSLNTSTSSSGNNRYQSVEARQNAVNRGDIGWRLARQIGTQVRDDAGVSYKASWGEVGTEVERSENETAYRASARGALAALDGHLFASNTVYDSFAVVDTDGLPGITVSRENRPLGKTDADGLMFVEDVRAYESNRLSIDPGDVPMDVSLSNSMLEIRPPDRSGTVVRFPIQHSRSATLVLVDDQHHPLLLGSHAVLSSNGEQSVVGYDGVTFFQNLAEHDHVSVIGTAQGACSVSFDYQPLANSIPQIGPLVCLPDTRP